MDKHRGNKTVLPQTLLPAIKPGGGVFTEDVLALFSATDGGVQDAQQASGAPIGIAVEATQAANGGVDGLGWGMFWMFFGV